MDIVVVFLVLGVAVWYLYRRYKNIVNPDSASCGCGGCDRGTGPVADNRKGPAREND